MKKNILMACSVALLSLPLYALHTPTVKAMHLSWDVDKDGVNDCEKDASCDHTVDYSIPRKVKALSYTDNFYNTVNNEWLTSHEINPKTGKISGMSIIEKNIQLQLKEILDRLDKAKKLTVDEQKIIDIYRSFVNVELRNKIGIAPLNDMLKTIQSANTHEDIAKLFATLFKVGVSGPLIITRSVGKKDSSKYVMTAMQYGLGLTKDTYLKTDKHSLEKVKYYREYLTKILSIAKLESVEKKVDEILKLEKKLAQIQLNKVELRTLSSTYKPADFKKLDAMVSNLHLEEMLNILGVNKNIEFDISSEKYIKAFNELFVKIDVKSWKSYLESRYIKRYGDLTVTAFDDAAFEYSKSLGLVSKPSPMWEKGLVAVNNMAGMLLGKVYVENYFNLKSKEKAENIVEDIILEFKEKISSTKLFTQATKDRAMKKINEMKFNVGYPDKWQDYEALKIDKADLFGNYKRYIAYRDARNLASLDKPVDKTKWSYTPQTLNAYYSPPENKFVVLASILQKPVFDVNASDAKNYGGIGMVIAHEIGHGFDDQGSQYDYKGDVSDWWEKEDRIKYMKNAEVLISQADHFEYLEGKHLNGKLEIGEIIGDLNGVTIALAAYEKIIKKNGLDREASLKAFFIQLAKVWRNKTEPHLLEAMIQVDNHPVSEFRVNGILKHIDTFHEIFETKKGDKMYMAPEKRVKLW